MVAWEIKHFCLSLIVMTGTTCHMPNMLLLEAKQRGTDGIFDPRHGWVDWQISNSLGLCNRVIQVEEAYGGRVACLETLHENASHRSFALVAWDVVTDN